MRDLPAVFDELKSILVPYAAQLNPTRDDDKELYIDTKHIQKNKRPLFFGAVQIKKSFVSFHLMPVYLEPELLTVRVHGGSRSTNLYKSTGYVPPNTVETYS